MGSAGKFITHIAALKCVERGLITLDESVYTHLPELENLDVISRNEGSDASNRPFLLQPPTKKITLRHLLTHSSGIDHESNPLVREWRASTGEKLKASYHPIAEAFSTPLLFEPGEGWRYGASIEWTSRLIYRLTKQPLGQYNQEHIFNPLGITSSTYYPQNHPDISSRILKMVRRDVDRLLPADYQVRELVSNVPDMATLLADLISPSSKLLKKENIDFLFAPQIAPSSAALSYLRRDTESYAAPAGIPTSITEPPVNHSLAALVVEGELPLSHMPAGTLTWNGMPNLIWAMHKK
jgi:CubicO group peptidase (beta-lactamase class C family)